MAESSEAYSSSSILHHVVTTGTFPPLSIARYSFIQLSKLGLQWRKPKCPIFETVAKGDSNPGCLDCESGVLPLSFRLVQALNVVIQFGTHNSHLAIDTYIPSVNLM